MQKEKAPTKNRSKLQPKNTKTVRRKPLSIWAVVAIVLTASMLLPSIFIGLDYLSGWRGPVKTEEDSWEKYLEQEWHRLTEESTALEVKIAADGPSEDDLEKLAALYGQAYSYALYFEPGAAEEYLEKMAKTYRSLLDLNPGSIEHRFSLYGTLCALGREEEARKEADLVRASLEPLLEAETATNLERYYYAALMADVYESKEEALAQLDLILETEPEDSPYHAHFTAYREELLAGETADPGETEKNDQAENSPGEEEEG